MRLPSMFLSRRSKAVALAVVVASATLPIAMSGVAQAQVIPYCAGVLQGDPSLADEDSGQAHGFLARGFLPEVIGVDDEDEPIFYTARHRYAVIGEVTKGQTKIIDDLDNGGANATRFSASLTIGGVSPAQDLVHIGATDPDGPGELEGILPTVPGATTIKLQWKNSNGASQDIFTTLTNNLWPRGAVPGLPIMQVFEQNKEGLFGSALVAYQKMVMVKGFANSATTLDGYSSITNAPQGGFNVLPLVDPLTQDEYGPLYAGSFLLSAKPTEQPTAQASFVIWPKLATPAFSPSFAAILAASFELETETLYDEDGPVECSIAGLLATVCEYEPSILPASIGPVSSEDLCLLVYA
jgi:hypothetical protein